MNTHHRPGMMTGISLLFPITLSTMAIELLAPILPRLLGTVPPRLQGLVLIPLRHRRGHPDRRGAEGVTTDQGN